MNTEEYIKFLPLTSLELAIVTLVCAVGVIWGRPEIIAGMHMSASMWTRLIMFGPISHNWIFTFSIGAALLVYVVREGRLNLIRYKPGLGPKGMFPNIDRWIVPWVLIWYVWVYLVLYMVGGTNPYNINLFVAFWTIPGVVTVFMIGHDLGRVRGFAFAYIATSIFGGLLALRVIDIPLSYLPQDPGLEGIIRLGLNNYHFFSRFCAMAVILSIGFFLATRHWWMATLALVSAGIMAYFVLLAGARQSMSGVIVTALLFVLWSLRRGGLLATRAAIIVGVVLFLGISIYNIAPNLVVRTNESDVSESFNVVEDRGGLWVIGMKAFLESPVWGTGFSDGVLAHNIFVSVLADHGLPGGIFFAGYLVFCARRLLAIWREKEATEASIWRLTFANIFVFAMVHAQAAGNAVKMPHLFFSIAMLWVLEYNFGTVKIGEKVPKPASFGASRWIAPRRPQSQS
jgi:O-antigen ligase